jgi:hypothetical protein
MDTPSSSAARGHAQGDRIRSADCVGSGGVGGAHPPPPVEPAPPPDEATPPSAAQRPPASSHRARAASKSTHARSATAPPTRLASWEPTSQGELPAARLRREGEHHRVVPERQEGHRCHQRRARSTQQHHAGGLLGAPRVAKPSATAEASGGPEPVSAAASCRARTLRAAPPPLAATASESGKSPHRRVPEGAPVCRLDCPVLVGVESALQHLGEAARLDEVPLRPNLQLVLEKQPRGALTGWAVVLAALIA